MQSNTVISPAQLSLLLASSGPLELLDVRTQQEFINTHVPGARLIPLDELNVENVLKHRLPGQPLYVICQSGMRAKKAIERFEMAGCSDCVLVEGGTQAWIDAGLPVERSASKVLPLLQQVQIVVGSLAAVGAFFSLAVNRWFALLPLSIGCGLLFAGLSGTCGIALLLARMPWNRRAGNHCLCLAEEEK